MNIHEKRSFVERIRYELKMTDGLLCEMIEGPAEMGRIVSVKQRLEKSMEVAEEMRRVLLGIPTAPQQPSPGGNRTP
jgi:hypothetical protein